MALPSAFPAQFTVNPRLSAISIMYTNPDGIADLVMPRFQVDSPQYLYSVFNKYDLFATSETKVGRTSRVNEIDWSSAQLPGTVDDHAIQEVVPRRDQLIAAAYPNSPDPRAMATLQINQRLQISRELRVANIVFNPASYATANKVSLTGTSQWSDFTNSDPLSAIMNAMDTMFVRPNQLVIGQLVATKLRTHPKVLQAAHGDNGAYGVTSLQFLAGLFGVDEVLVGQQWINPAVKGQNGTLARIWAKSAALLYTNKVSTSANTPSFGATAQWGERLTGEYFDENKGMRGSDILRVGESVGEIVLASDMGYLFQNAVA